MQSLNKKNMGKHLFPNWHHFQIGFLFRPDKHFFHGHTSKRLDYYRTTAAVSLLFYIGFHGQTPLFERCLRGGAFPIQRHH